MVFWLFVLWLAVFSCYALAGYGGDQRKGAWYLVVDIYSVAWTSSFDLWLFGCISCALDSADHIGEWDWGNLWLNLPGAFALLRLYEIFSFISSLHVKRST